MKLPPEGWAVADVSGLGPWLEAARRAGDAARRNPDLQARWLRHDGTWFVGVDVLPSDARGALGDATLPLDGLPDLHRGQVSVIYPGYPGTGRGDPAAHRFRVRRDGAHVDGLHRDGAGRRVLRELHRFVLGLPLDVMDMGNSPLVVWSGSHRIMAEMFRRTLAGLDPQDWGEVDFSGPYKAARLRAFDDCPRTALRARPGQAIWLHRHLVHGIAPWGEGGDRPRRVVYFRPEYETQRDWLALE